MLNDPQIILRRLALWAVICCVSAAPSFAWANEDFSRAAMLFGVAVYIAAYTLSTCTEWFERFHRRPFVRRTLYVGYGARLAISILFPIGMGLDMMPGLLSIAIVQRLGLEPHTFGGTFATTLVQGALLNVIVMTLMTVVYGLQRVFAKPPPTDDTRHGFAVLPTRTPIRAEQVSV